jgi:hypothetical protein
MEKRMGAKLEMWRTVAALEDNPTYAPLISSVPGIASGFAALKGNIVQAETFDVSRGGAAAVVGPAKQLARELLVDTASVVDGIFTAHAAATNDLLLLAEVNKEITDLRKMREEELRAHCQALIERIPDPISAPLTDLGLSAALKTTLEARYATWQTLMTMPQSRTSQESTFVQLIQQIEDAVDRLLDLQLDKLMRQFKSTQAQFYIEYKEARTIRSAATSPEEEEETDGSGGGTGGTGGTGGSGDGTGGSGPVV